jgi:hypothetical protein
MGRPLKWTVEQKLPLVLSILRGEAWAADSLKGFRSADYSG